MDHIEENLDERQEDEVEALKSIYDCDFDDLRKQDVWKVRRPPEFLLKIRPDHDSRGAQQTCTVDLHVKCCKKYPLVAPELELINAKACDFASFHIISNLVILKKRQMCKIYQRFIIYNLTCHSDAVSGWAGWTSEFGSSVNPILTKGGRVCPPHY